MQGDQYEAELDRATSFLRGGVRRPDIEQGLRVIETWEQRLAASERDELIAVAETLAELRIQLLAGDAAPEAIGDLLVNLGEQVSAVASSDVGKPVSEGLSELATLLAEEGGALSREG